MLKSFHYLLLKVKFIAEILNGHHLQRKLSCAKLNIVQEQKLTL